MKDFLLAFIPIFIAVDPVGLLPILVSITQGCDRAVKRKVAVASMITALMLSLGFMLIGHTLFRFLGVSMGDFMIAGGIILFCIALIDLLSPQKHHRVPALEMAVVPIGTPLIAGPALLTTSLMLMGQHGFGLTALCVVINILIAGVMFLISEAALAKLSLGGTRAVSKVVSLLLAAIAVMMIRKGFIAVVGVG